MAYEAVEWDKAPRFARWWAIDGDGAAFWFCEPNLGHDSGFWYAERISAPTFGYAGDYRESLTMRREKAARKRRTVKKPELADQHRTAAETES